MFENKTHKTVAPGGGSVACLAAAGVVRRGLPVKLSGAITGVVTDTARRPADGRDGRSCSTARTGFEKVADRRARRIQFPGLFPGLLHPRHPGHLRPRLKQTSGAAGHAQRANVNLSTAVQHHPVGLPAGRNGSLMSDDWKWVLRSAASTRPVLRFCRRGRRQRRSGARAAVFSDHARHPQGLGGRRRAGRPVGNEADLGTAFALATSLYGNNLLQVSGNLGYGSQTGVPAAAFRTSYQPRLRGGTPEVSLTMRQLFLPGRLGRRWRATRRAADAAHPCRRLEDESQIADRSPSVRLHPGFGFVPRSISTTSARMRG